VQKSTSNVLNASADGFIVGAGLGVTQTRTAQGTFVGGVTGIG